MSSFSRSRPPEPCPACGSTDAIPIVYGFPGSALAEASMRGEVVLGGCMVQEGNPAWCCRRCETRWGLEDKEQ